MIIIWIGLVVPPELEEAISVADRYLTVQTQKFQRSVIAALEGVGNHQVRIISSPPITDWSRIRLFGLKRWAHTGSPSQDWVVPVANFFGVKQVCVLLGCFLGGLVALCQSGRRNCVVMVGDSYFPHLLAAVLISRLGLVRTIGIVTDMPGLLAVADPWYKRVLRPLDDASVRWMLGKMHGLVVLSRHIATDFFPTKPFMVMPGICDPADLADAEAGPQPHPDRFVVMYSGGLVREYGLDLLLESFVLLSGDDYQLWITGKGDGELMVRAAAENDRRILFLGFLADRELRERQRQANVLINLRITHQGHARYSFPSKLFGYMAQRRFVLSNRFPSLPDDYARHLIILEEETPEALAEVLRQLRTGGYGAMEDFGRRCSDFIRREAGPAAQGVLLNEFLIRISGTRTQR